MESQTRILAYALAMMGISTALGILRGLVGVLLLHMMCINAK
jgi:hypothetical protein